eukprot:915762_1
MNFLFKSFLFGILSMTSRIQGQAPGLCESCLQSCARGWTSIQICNDETGFCNGAYLGQSCGGPSRSVCCSAGSCAIATTPPDTIEILYVGPFPFNICQAVTCIFGICDDNDFSGLSARRLISDDSSDQSDSFDGDNGERLDEFIDIILNKYCSENPENCLDFDAAAHYVFSANKSIETDDNVTDAESLEITLNVNGSIWYILYGLLMVILNMFLGWYFSKYRKRIIV